MVGFLLTYESILLQTKKGKSIVLKSSKELEVLDDDIVLIAQKFNNFFTNNRWKEKQRIFY